MLCRGSAPPRRFGSGMAGAHRIASDIQSTAARKCRAGRLARSATSAPGASWRRKSMYGGCRFVQTCCALRRSHFRRYLATAWTDCRPGATTISASSTWRQHRECHRWWTVVRSDNFSIEDIADEGMIMKKFDVDSLRILEKIEDEFRNQYWVIRNSRRTNWRAVNRTRMLGDFMYMLGIPKWAVQQARYCLRLRVC